MARLSDAVAGLLAQPPEVGERAQAFPFLTVDDRGLPHVALLSARELAVDDEGSLLVALMGMTTGANVQRSGTATLLAVEGTTAHSVKLRLRRIVDDGDLLGLVLEPVDHKADSLGVDLAPISYVATQELAMLERWDRTAALLARLGERKSP
jgi:hypothetical protein